MIIVDVWLVVALIIAVLFLGTILGLWIAHALP